MQCPACGRENRASAGFCAWCGESLPQGVVVEPLAETTNSEERPPDAEGAPVAQEETAGLPTGALPTMQEAPTTEDEGLSSSEEAVAVADLRRNRSQTSVDLSEAKSPIGPLPRLRAEEPPAEAAKGPASLHAATRPKPGQETARDMAKSPSSGADRPIPAPLQPGDVLGGRYRIEKLLESGPEQNVYSAIDLCLCPSCGHDANPPDETYCLECGASLEKPHPRATITEQVRRAPEQFDVHFSEGERDYFVTAEPVPAVEETEAERAPALRLQWGRATDQGLQRDHNEDYVEAWLYARGSGGSLGLFVVADGLGGQDLGEVASRLATETVWEALRPTVWEPIIRGETMEPEVLEEKLAQAVLAANQAVYDERIARNSGMSTTLTLALVVDDTAHIANVGDSRTYIWNADGLRQITQDHSLVQRLVDAGAIAPEQVYTHPQRNLIYQSIGDRPEVRVDTFRHQLAPDDRLLLCSDGLWEMVRHEGLEEVLLAEPDPQRAADRLLRNANLAGGEDNISVIIVRAVGN